MMKTTIKFCPDLNAKNSSKPSLEKEILSTIKDLRSCSGKSTQIKMIPSTSQRWLPSFNPFMLIEENLNMLEQTSAETSKSNKKSVFT
jgi:hypothetical protein